MSKPKILIVDDKLENLIALESVLSSLAVEFVKSTNGNDALIHTLNDNFSLAILDVQMPDMDGFELARYIRSNPDTRQLPIIFLSAAYSDYDHVFKGYESGAIDYLVKPYEPEFLKGKVNIFVELYLHRTKLEQLVDERTAMLSQSNEKLKQQNNFLETVFESMRHPFAVINTENCTLDMSNSSAETFSLVNKIGTDSISCDKTTCHKHVENAGINDCFINQIYHSKSPIRKEFIELDTTGEKRFYDLYAYPILNKDNTEQVIVSIFDISERKREEVQRQIASQVLESIMEAIIVLDNSGNIQLTNPAFTSMTDYFEREVIGKNLDFLKSDIHDNIFYSKLKHALLKTGQWKGEVWLKKKNHEIFPLLLSITPVKGIRGSINGYVAAGQDITRQKETENKMRHQAHHDDLTGLPNRQLFRDRMGHAIKRAQRNKNKIALLFIDIDHFKNINDSHGHDTGDLFLKEVGKEFSNCIRESDTVYRLGGDEFTIILENIRDAEDDVHVVANKLLNVFAKPFNIEGNEFFLGASIGVSIFPDNGNTPDILIKNADTAMYCAKDNGRNNFQFFDQKMGENLINMVTMEHDLRKGLDKDEFEVYYQPIIDIKTKSIVSMEALVRWNHPTKGIVLPNTFISVAENKGLIVPIGALVLAEACKEIKFWNKCFGGNLTISVNLSAKQFREKDLVKSIDKILKNTQLLPQSLTLEITETILMDDIELSVSTMRDLKAMGIKLSMDDFGTGYSSLNYLKQFPVDYLKLDHSFIKDILTDSDAAQIATTMISLASNMGLTVIAEGVEETGQLEFLETNGCHLIQGFLFSKPVTKSDLTQIFHKIDNF